MERKGGQLTLVLKKEHAHFYLIVVQIIYQRTMPFRSLHNTSNLVNVPVNKMLQQPNRNDIPNQYLRYCFSNSNSKIKCKKNDSTFYHQQSSIQVRQE